MNSLRASVLLGAILASVVANAHHSFQATFTSDKPITVEGVVTDYRFKNPHVLVFLDVTSEDGTVTRWMSEGGSATGLRRRGWDRDTIPKGQRVRITGDSTHDGSPMVSIGTVEFLDAESNAVVRTLGRDRQPEETQGSVVLVPLKLDDGRPNLTGAWVQHQNSSFRGRPEEIDGVPPFNEAGAAAQAAFNRADDPQIFCEPPGLVRQAGFTPHPLRITQYADRVVIEYEEYGGTREVYLGDEPAPPGEKSHLGDSVARYDGDALIIETRNLLSNPSQPWGYQMTDQAATVEVYKRTDDPRYGSVVFTETTVTDPGYLKEPWVLRREKLFSEGYEFIENECYSPLRERSVKVD